MSSAVIEEMWLYVLLALGVGVLVALQPVVNSRLASYTGPLVAATISFLLGAIVLSIVTLLSNPISGIQIKTLDKLRQIPPQYFTGGIIGAAVVLGMTKLVPELGVVGTLGLAITGQIIFSAMADHWGLFGIARVPLDASRLIGILLLLVGVRLALRST